MAMVTAVRARVAGAAIALSLVAGCSAPTVASSVDAVVAAGTTSPSTARSTTSQQSSPSTTTTTPSPSSRSNASSSPTTPATSDQVTTPVPPEAVDPTTPAGSDGTAVAVLSVIDGDTFHALVDGQDVKVRIIGIDTPETTECGFDSATAAATAVLSGRIVQLTPDPTQDDQDRYDRLLRYVTLPDGQDFGNYMVGGGFAYEYTFDNPYAHQDDYRAAEAAATARSLGLWASSTCAGQRSVAVTVPSTPAAAPSPQVPPAGAGSGQTGQCDIKGNISDNGQIYHVPGSRDYEKTKINEAKGERWFCSVDEAEAAGWRAPESG